MSGFKQALIDKLPLMFLTFDGDAFDPVKRTTTAVPAIIMDESGNDNNAIIHDDALSTEFFGYRMGMPSTVDLEPADQYAMAFGYYGPQPLHPSIWAKTYLEVPHSSSFEFPNFGSFSVSFMMNKASHDENTFRNYTSSTNTSTLTRPIIRKGLAFKLDHIDVWSGTDYLNVVYPAGTITYGLPAAFYAKNNHVAFAWDVELDPNGFYSGIASLYVNGVLVSTASHTFLDTYPASNVSSPWEIAGTAAAGGTDQNDRQTSSLTLDQIAVYDFGLTQDDVCFLFKKTRSYENMINSHTPYYFYTMGDVESQTSTDMAEYNGSNLDARYVGGTAKVIRDQAGPKNIVDSTSTRFQQGGCAIVHDSSSSWDTPIFDPRGNYSIEFWFTAENGDQSVMLAMQSDEVPYNGMLIQMNTKDDIYSNGMVQFSINDNWSISSRELKDDNLTRFQFNDGYWHHLVAIRRGSMIELWIDGVLHSQKSAPLGTIGRYGQMALMGMMPGKLNTTGNMCELVLYNLAIAPAIIRCHYTYALVYRIRGNVTLQGVPYRANVRIYRHQNGELISEVQSDASDGNYIIELFDNSLIDLMVLNIQDKNVRYRAYGPITPAEHEDLPA